MDDKLNSEIKPASAAGKKTAVVLFQLGGPDSLEAVEPFLFNLFNDADIIDFPLAFLFRKFLAKSISRRRSGKVQENYRLIGGKSPILELTRLQADALQTSCLQRGFNLKVLIAMRYWHPQTEAAVKEIKEIGFDQALLLPLYPQFSQATTYSSINEWNRQAKKIGLSIPMHLICCYPNHPFLIEAFAGNINRTLERFQNVKNEDIDLVFSAHGVPESYIRKGDPYQMQIEETVKRIMEYGKWRSPHTLCYQSKVGPMKWLKPSLLETVEMFARKGRKNVLVIPVAFVTDHIETLHEINIDVRNHAEAQGIKKFEVMPALNDNPKFIECLSDLVVNRLTKEGHTRVCDLLSKQNDWKRMPKKCPNYNPGLGEGT
jgi:protoporphyrin/coproporphyrin ferrochelatase